MNFARLAPVAAKVACSDPVQTTSASGLLSTSVPTAWLMSFAVGVTRAVAETWMRALASSDPITR